MQAPGPTSAPGNAEAIEAAQPGDAIIGYGDVARRSLSEAEMFAILRSEIDEREASIVEYLRVGRPDRAQSLEREVEVLQADLGRT